MLDMRRGPAKCARAALRNLKESDLKKSKTARTSNIEADGPQHGDAARMPSSPLTSSKRGVGSDSDAAIAPVTSYEGPERLVGVGFRLWLNGFRTGDITNWEEAFSTYARTIGAPAAGRAVGQLSSWVRAIDFYAQRKLVTSANDARRFCHDECVAIAMIAACQHHACPAMRACAFALLGCSMIEEVVDGAESFARTLREADQVLSPASAQTASLLLMPPATAWRH